MSMNNWLAIAPEIGLVVLLFILLGYNSFVKPSDGRAAGLLTAWGVVIILVVTMALAWAGWGEIAQRTAVQLPFKNPAVPTLSFSIPRGFWGNMIVMDPIGIVFRFIFLLALLFTTLFSLDTKSLQKAEYFALLIAATIGFNLMAVSADLVMLVVALETASLSLYLLAGFMVNDRRSPEAGIKYFLYGAFASALMFYGFSLLYGVTQQTNIFNIAQIVIGGGTVLSADAVGLSQFNSLIVVSAVLLLVGLGFKIAAVPFHWWAPDVYEGAPTPVTGFASTASKAAGFALLFRLFAAGVVGLPSENTPWWPMLVTVCIITMLTGNMLAIFQTNIKRMLAYSSVAQAGYVLIGLVTLTSNGSSAAMFYLLLYMLTNVAAFGGIALISNHTGADNMQDLYGLSRRSPYLALAMMMALLSLGGIPPTAGFFGKFFLFKAAIEAGYWWLALIGILMAFISLYYYLNIVKYIYLYRSENDSVAIPISRAAKVALVLSVGGILYLGIFAGPAFEWTQKAAQWFFLQS